MTTLKLPRKMKSDEVIFRWAVIGGLLVLATALSSSASVSSGSVMVAMDGVREPDATFSTTSPPTLSASDLKDDDLRSSMDRAWEYRPYRVAVWICADGAPQLSSNLQTLLEELDRRAEIIDPSGWNLHFAAAPGPFRWKFLENLQTPERLTGFEKDPSLASYDKLMVVCIAQQLDSTQISVRECDLTTLHWGAIQNRSAGYYSQVAVATMDAIKRAFMPLARIGRVDLKGPDTEVFLQVRAAESCLRLELTENKEWMVRTSVESPVFIKPNDWFQPIIRHTDRDGKLLKLQPVEATFLTIDRETENKDIVCSVVSSHHSPLAGRKSKTAERLALVIRPPRESTWLYLRSSDRSKSPVNGIKVYSTKPVAHEAEYKLLEPEYLGKTDWEGKIEIPPSSDGIRMLTMGRGGRPLLRLPVIPGLYPVIATDVANDETSLLAEGIVRGFEAEILNLIIQRDVLESEIDSLLEARQLQKAKEKFELYKVLIKMPDDIRSRILSEQSQLQSVATDRRQINFIQNRFSDLLGILSARGGVEREVELLSKIQVQSSVPGAVVVPSRPEPE